MLRNMLDTGTTGLKLWENFVCDVFLVLSNMNGFVRFVINIVGAQKTDYKSSIFHLQMGLTAVSVDGHFQYCFVTQMPFNYLFL